MIELILLNYLNEKLQVNVYTEKPSNPPPSYVLIDKTGSGKVNHLPDATVAFQSYADTKYNAALLNEEVKTAIEQMADELHEIRGVTLNGDYPFTDVQTKSYRYQAVYDIRYY